MARKYLQISLVGTELGTHVNVTPYDKPVSDEAAEKFQEFISLLDMTDDKPGDGIVEEAVHISLPINFWFIHTKADFDGQVVAKIVEKSE